MPPLRAVLFDLDNTLLDYDRAERFALRQALDHFGFPLSAATLQAYHRINDDLWEQYRRGRVSQPVLARERFRRLLNHLGGEARRASALSAAYLRALAKRGDTLPGCRRLLARLAKRFRLGVVSNGIDRVQRGRLSAAGLNRRFDTVVTSEGCGFVKPDPRILHVALRALCVGPDEAAYVGDDLATDGGAARAAGVAFFWLTRNGAHARRPRSVRRLSSLDELLQHLG